MSVGVVAVVTGVDTVEAKLKAAAARGWARVKRAVERSGLELQADVKQNQLTGNALMVRTGRLRRSITQRFVADESTATSKVGTNVAYGRFHEFGFRGDVAVGAHSRRLRSTGKRGGKGKLGSGGRANVRAHVRHVNYAGNPFLKPEFDHAKSRIHKRLAAAMRELKNAD